MARVAQPIEFLPAPGRRFTGEDMAVQGGDKPDMVGAENNARIRDFLSQRSSPVGSEETVALAAGGEMLTAFVKASGMADPTKDTRVPHRLGRVPQAIIYQRGTGTLGDQVIGVPAGGATAGGGNATPWTSREVFVRSSIDRAFTFAIS